MIWLEPAPDNDDLGSAGFDGAGFGIDNLPHGVFSPPGQDRRVGVAIGGYVLDVAALAHRLAPELADLFTEPTLNRFLAAGPAIWRGVRERLTDWLGEARHADAVRPHLHARDGVALHLPVAVGDYVDFYASREHAENLGRVLRPGQPALTPNWLHLPIGYHGRAGTIVVSGTGVRRPAGQRAAGAGQPPSFGPSQRLDVEVEVAFVVGTPSRLGEPVPLADFEEHVFGACLLNDWSARDIQAWEYVPLGPFLGKSFATSLSPWVVPLAALRHARVPPPAREVPPLPYLREPQPWGLAIDLELRLNGYPVSRPPFAGMYWTPAQMLAHLTVNGASVRTGDLYASGTVSGARPGEQGSLIELTANGRQPLELPDGTRRGFLADGDEVVIAASAPGPAGARIGFGEVSGRVLPGSP